MRNDLLKRAIAWVVMATLTITQSSQVAALTLATQPLASTTSDVVRPNIMYVLDDSGSMAWDFTPDYINDATVSDPASSGYGLPGSSGDAANATVSGGKVTAVAASGINVYSKGTPTVIIEGGGGTGASATAVVSATTKKITGITVTNQGSGYTSTPYVALVGGLNNAGWGMCWGTTGTNNLGGTPKDTTASPTCTTPSQMPYAAGKVNYQYYDSSIRYDAPINADGSSYANSTFTAAKQNGYSGATTTDLSGAYTHEIWCNTASPSPTPNTSNIASHTQCRENIDTSGDALYPNAAFNFRKTYQGPAFYYVMEPSEFCTDDTYTNCVRSTAPTVSSGVTFNVPSFYRWCSYYNPLTRTFGGCQGRRDLDHYIPNYLGGWISSTTSPGSQATATMTIDSLLTGQSLTGLTISGVDVVDGATFVEGDSYDFTGSPSGTRTLSTRSDIAQAICEEVNRSTDTTGYGCSHAGTSLILQSAVVGAVANGREVVASGPPDVSAITNSTGEITVSEAPTNFQITGIALTRTDSSTAELISNSITATSHCGGSTGVSCGAIAQSICNAINSGPNSSTYIAKSGNPADPLLDYGTCQSTIDAWVGIKRVDTSSIDNGATINVSGPATGNQYPGTITISSIAGIAKIDDIRLGGISILTSKPMLFADGTQTAAIASAIAANISIAGCTANTPAGSSTVYLSGSASCNGTLTVTAAGTQSTGTFRVSNIGTAGHAGSLAYVDVGTTRIVGVLTASQLPSITNASANASTLRTQINNGTLATSNSVGPHGFTAAAPVVNGSYYDVTVTAPAGSTYNGQSFSFGSGSAAAGSAGQPSIWTFKMLDATADNAHITSITCGGTAAVPDLSTGTTTANSTYVQNLAITGATNGLDGKTSAGLAGYSYACTNAAMTSPAYRCTVTGPAGAPACANLAIAKDATISLSTSAPAAVGGTAGTPAQWTFTISDATTDDREILTLRCGTTSGSPNTIDNAVNTGNSSNPDYDGTLADAINSASNSQNGWNGTSGCTDSGTTVSCFFERNAGVGNRCAGNSATVTKSGGATFSVGAVSETWTGSRYRYDFSISNVTQPNESITQVACSGNSSATSMSSSASTGNAASRNVQRINNLAADLESEDDGPDYSIDCTTATNVSPTSSCTVTGTSSCTSPTLRFYGDSSSGIYIDGTASSNQVTNSGRQFGTFAGASGATSPTWTFDILDATTANRTISAITCGGSSIRPTNAPSTGSAPADSTYQRINNLTGATPPSTSGTVGPTNGYTLSCPPATAAETQPTCTLTGPVGTPACTDTTTGDFVINKDSTISIGTVTRTQAGTASNAGTDDFAPNLSTVSPFSSAYGGQPTTATGISATPISTGTISTSTTPMTSVSPVSVQTIPTNAQGTAGSTLILSGGTDPDLSTNRWTRVGVFKRVDVVSTNNSYNRTSGRTDCAGLTCTFAEESVNFANWYTYYRTRINMMKSATTAAFDPVDGGYRVGFDNICQATGTTVKRTVAQFVDSGGETSNQRTNWWSSLTSTSPSCATPLRAQTAKIGKYFGHKLGTVADPMQYSCQQNFMILVTDGYWNESEPMTGSLTGSDIGNKDNNTAAGAAPYTAARPFYDGQQASTACPGSGTRSAASSCRTLADIAWYYYSTDMRSSTLSNDTGPGSVDVATNNVLVTADDQNTAQHMNFFAMGLGIEGYLTYRADYETAGLGDFASIKAGTLDWPAVSNLDPSGVDDLWHATVNGHGKYFSARNVPAVVAGLQEALRKIGSRVGSAAAAATSNLEPVAGDNFAYVASYSTNFWVGDLQSRSIDIATGDVSSDTNCSVAGSGCQWSAQAELDDMTWSARRIYVAPQSDTTGNPLRPFTYDNLTATEKAYFDPSTGLSQSGLQASNSTVMTSENLVNFLRGDRSLEQDGDNSHAQIWRKRANVLGDIVNTQPIYMKAPSLNYADDGYAEFKSAGTASNRKPVVFVSAQDGMLHVFNAHTAAVTVSGVSVNPGEEMWSYIPKQALPALKQLASATYSHRYFVDGPITVGDVDFGGGDWHTILVAGMGAGGTAYFALDVTDPLNPAYLWEFTNTGLGYTFSNPILSKLPNGDWAVLFSSGYNNADGLGKLFAVNPQTGAILTGFPMSTASGTAGSPSNLGKIAVWADNPATDNTAEYVYAGDINGDLWRFDLDPFGSGHSGIAVHRLAHLAGPGSVAQPITTKPELTLLPDGTRVVFVGTGKYLEETDKDNADVQSFYGIKDPLDSTTTWDPRSDTISVDVSGTPTTVPAFLQNKFVSTFDGGTTPITQTVNGATRNVRMICRGTSSTVGSTSGLCENEDSTTMNWGVYGGWFVDFPETKERMNVDMKLVLGSLVFATNIPVSDSCTVGGSAWANVLYYQDGLAVPGSDGIVGLEIADSLVVGVTVVKLSTGEYKAILTKSNYQQETTAVPICTGSECSGSSNPSGNAGGFMSKRGLWREFEAY
jgi:type IV pilus assembly protein PilY1